MNGLQRLGWICAGLLLGLSALFPMAGASGLVFFLYVAGLFFILAGVFSSQTWVRNCLAFPMLAIAVVAETMLVHAPGVTGNVGTGFSLQIVALWLAAWLAVETIANPAKTVKPTRWHNLAPPLLFGLTLLILWEWIDIGFGIQEINLLAPSAIGAAVWQNAPVLLQDFVWTFLREALLGWAIGSAAGFAMALVADRIPFLRRGLLPLGSVVSALPIIGIAPIMIWWFSFDWPSKTAVVIAMTFFPMLVNTVAGLSASGNLERDLMRSYGAGYWPTLLRLRLPAAMPFIFNGLKINSTLALIGAIVAEYFDGPTVGMGFRINTRAALSDSGIVFSEIAVSMVAGSLFYFAIALFERAVTFWHPSYRRA